MATVDQMLRAQAQRQGTVPYWVLEKDYALSYLLAGIAETPALQDGLILKGGTALRKCYFEDYRFSEDLDFSLRPGHIVPDADEFVQQAVERMEQLLHFLADQTCFLHQDWLNWRMSNGIVCYAPLFPNAQPRNRFSMSYSRRCWTYGTADTGKDCRCFPACKGAFHCPW